MRVTILNRVWNLRFAPNMARKTGQNRGDCDSPGVRGKEIRVAASLLGEERLEVLLHEMIHCAGWHIDEPIVEAFADNLAWMLWRCRYRDTGPSVPFRNLTEQCLQIDRLAVLIRVMLRTANWHIAEEFVQQFAGDVARALWRLGYREI